MTTIEMSEKITLTVCGKCFGATDRTSYGKTLPFGCMINRKAWTCGGPFTQGELHDIMDEEEEAGR